MDMFRSASRKYYMGRYRRRDDRWSNRGDTFTAAAVLRGVLHTLAKARQVNLLDIGCGRMPVTLPFAKKLQKLSVVGVEWALAEVLAAHPDFEVQVSALERVLVIEADFMSFLCAPRFDLAVDFGTFHHIVPRDWPKFLGRLHRLLRPEGQFLLETFHVDDHNWGRSSPGGHIRKGYYCHYHNLESIKETFGGVFCEIQELPHTQNWEHVKATYHMRNMGRLL